MFCCGRYLIIYKCSCPINKWDCLSNVLLWYDLHLYLLLGATWQNSVGRVKEGKEPLLPPVSSRSHATSPCVSCFSLGGGWLHDFWWVCLLASVCFGLLIDCLLKKWAETLQTHFSASCAVCGKSCLLILIMYIYMFQKLAAKLQVFLQIRAGLCNFFCFVMIFCCFYLKNLLFMSL